MKGAIKWLAAAGALLVVMLLHAPILRTVARCLIVDQRNAAAEYTLVLGGDRCFDLAAKQFRAGEIEETILHEWLQRRLSRMGVLPPWHEIGLRELKKRGIPEEHISVLHGKPMNRWQAARVLNKWLQQNPDARVVVLSDRFYSGLEAYVYEQELDNETRKRVSIMGLADRRFDETNWWRSKTGVKALTGAVLSQCYARTRGESPQRNVRWDPEEYEAALFR